MSNIVHSKKSSSIPKYGAKPEKGKSITFWLALCTIVFFLFISPFQAGLFNGYTLQFEKPISSAVAWSAVLLAILAVYLLQHWKLANYTDLLSLYIWLIPLSFLLASIHAASPHLAKGMFNLHMMYSVFFLFGMYIGKDLIGRKVIQYAILFSGYLIVLFGFLNLFGNTYYRDAVMLTESGTRLTSVFQYPNAYAALLMALLFAGLFLIVNARKWYTVAGHSLLIVPIIVSFLLTLSRGGIVFLPIGILLILPFLLLTRQIMYILYLIIGTIAAFLVTDPITRIGTEIAQKVQATMKPDLSVSLDGLGSLSVQGWLYLSAVTITSALLITLLQIYATPHLEKFGSKWNQYRLSSIILPIVGIAATTLVAVALFSTNIITNLMPTSLQQRVENINFKQNSVLERSAFYKDSIQMIQDYPLLGAGGGGWAALYEKYQSNPYTSRQTHSFFLQYLLEVGMIGLGLLLILLIYIFHQFIRSYRLSDPSNRHSHMLFYIFIVSLLLHSTIDFELSYALLSAIVFLCLGGMASFIQTSEFKFKGVSRSSRLKFAYPGLLGVLAIVIFSLAIVNIRSHSLFNQSLAIAQSGKSFQEVLVPMDRALGLQPDNPQMVLTKVDMLLQVYKQSKDERYYTEANEILNDLKVREPNNRNVLEQEYNLIMIKNQLPQAIQVMENGVEKFPWVISIYDRVIALTMQVGEQSRLEKKFAEMNQNWDQTIHYYNAVITKTKELENLPEGQQQGNDFGLTANMKLAVGQIYYIRGDYPAATATLQSGISDKLDVEVNQQITRWYLATLRKQGKDDKAIYDKLIATVPKEKDEIDRILNSTFVVK